MIDWIEKTGEAVRAYLGISHAIMLQVVWSLLVIVIFLLVRWVATRLIERYLEDPARSFHARKSLSYGLGFLTFLVLVLIWAGRGSGVLTYLGILSAGLAIAFQEPLVNLAGWLFIVWRRPLEVGDRVEINSIAGDVVDLRLFQFSIIEIGNWVQADQSTGRIIHIPNGQIFRYPLANFTTGFNFIWNEIAVMVTFESDWEKAEKILMEIAENNSQFEVESARRQIRKASHKYLVLYTHLTPMVWLTVADSGVTLTIRYLCAPRKRRSSETAIWKDILAEFGKAPDIDFAYPTKRMYYNKTEGKPEAGGPIEM